MKKSLRKVVMLVAMAISISMLTGCASFLLAVLDDSDGSSSSRTSRESTQRRKPTPRRKPQPKPKPRPRPRPRPRPKPTTSGDATYTVEHYQQNTDDNKYIVVSADKETWHGNVGEKTTAVAIEYEGFKVRPFSQKKITANGKTVVKIYYDRKYTTITFDLAGGRTDSKTKLRGKYGSTVSDFIEDPTKEGYEFDGWNYALPIEFPSENETYVAQWKAVEVAPEPEPEVLCTVGIGFDETVKIVIPKKKRKELEKRGFWLGAHVDESEEAAYLPFIEIKVPKGTCLSSVISMGEIKAMTVPAMGYEYSGLYTNNKLADAYEPITENTGFMVKAKPKKVTDYNPYGPYRVTITVAPVLYAGPKCREFCSQADSPIKLNSAGNVFSFEIPAGEPLSDYINLIPNDFWVNAPCTEYDGVYEGDKKVDLTKSINIDKYYIMRSKSCPP